MDLGATLRQSLMHLGQYRRSLHEVRALVEATRPDLVINFFEPLTGLHQLVRPLPVPVLSIAHQFMIPHPSYVRAEGKLAEQWGLRRFVSLVGCRSWKLALSLTPEADLPEQHLTVSPPLLRQQLFRLESTPGRYVLIYILNHAYAEEITDWQRANPEAELHCFYDRPGAPEAEEVQPNLTFHRLNGDKFLTLMAGCRAVVCTAGFESVCEAAWLGKPLFVVPVENHAEQRLNALEVVRAGFGIADRAFNLDRLRELPPRLDNRRFRAWVAQADRILERALVQATAGGKRTSATATSSTPPDRAAAPRSA